MCRLFIVLCCALISSSLSTLPDARPAVDDRTYTSESIDNLISTLTPLFIDPDIAALFSNCLPNTLDTTVFYSGPSDVDSTVKDSFVITGDIAAMWLRDSTNQVVPYIPYAPKDAALQSLLEGLINRQARSVLLDPFANSFNYNASGEGHQDDSRTPPMTASVFEGKYEIDSLGAFLKLSYWYWSYMGDSVLSIYESETWQSAVEALLNTLAVMQKDDGMQSSEPYKFQRGTSEALDTLIMQGRGPPSRPCGLSRSLFRPSDDAVTMSYNIPGNAMACVELGHLEKLLNAMVGPNSAAATQGVSPGYGRPKPPLSAALKERILRSAARANTIAGEICSALETVASTQSMAGVLPFEVDGGIGAYYIDDANVPSLLSLPLLGYLSADTTAYQATRAFIQSTKNPFWFSGTDGEGIGGPHVGPNRAWPMAIVVRAMTSNDEDEIRKCLKMLVTSSAGSGFMHETFNVNNAKIYSRSWFAWANGLFGELILQLVKQRPALVLTGDADAIAAAQALVEESISIRAQSEAAARTPLKTL
jgi:uncharacterized protein